MAEFARFFAEAAASGITGPEWIVMDVANADTSQDNTGGDLVSATTDGNGYTTVTLDTTSANANPNAGAVYSFQLDASAANADDYSVIEFSVDLDLGASAATPAMICGVGVTDRAGQANTTAGTSRCVYIAIQTDSTDQKVASGGSVTSRSASSTGGTSTDLLHATAHLGGGDQAMSGVGIDSTAGNGTIPATAINTSALTGGVYVFMWFGNALTDATDSAIKVRCRYRVWTPAQIAA